MYILCDTEEEDIEVEVSVCVDVEISFSKASLTTRKHASGIIFFNPIYSLRLLDFPSSFVLAQQVQIKFV